MAVDADNTFDESYNVGAHVHGLWDVVRRTGTNSHAAAQADSEANAAPRRVGLVVEDVDVDNYRVLDLRGCKVQLPTNHPMASTFGAAIFLSPDTEALMTTTAPTGPTESVLYLGYVVDAKTIFWEPDTVLYNTGDEPGFD